MVGLTSAEHAQLGEAKNALRIALKRWETPKPPGDEYEFPARYVATIHDVLRLAANRVSLEVRGSMAPSSLVDPRRVAVVHGRNAAARDGIFHFLRALDLRAVEWEQAVKETRKGTPHNMAILDALFAMTQGAARGCRAQEDSTDHWRRSGPSIIGCFEQGRSDRTGPPGSLKGPMKNEKAELLPPPTLDQAERAMEMARIWIVDGHQHVVLFPNLWRDPASWGLMLVDIARHVASAYVARGDTVRRMS